jgi:hypothetical protein
VAGPPLTVACEHGIDMSTGEARGGYTSRKA